MDSDTDRFITMLVGGRRVILQSFLKLSGYVRRQGDATALPVRETVAHPVFEPAPSNSLETLLNGVMPHTMKI
jgi:hypothetical protein